MSAVEGFVWFSIENAVEKYKDNRCGTSKDEALS